MTICEQGLVAFVSPACATLLGFRPDELFDRPLSSILAPECHEDFEVGARDAVFCTIVCQHLPYSCTLLHAGPRSVDNEQPAGLIHAHSRQFHGRKVLIHPTFSLCNQVRSLATHELVTTHTFLRKDGSRIMLDGVGQAWQRG